MVLGLTAVLLPLVAATASTEQLTLSPTRGPGGPLVSLDGAGFIPGATLEVYWGERLVAPVSERRDRAKSSWGDAGGASAMFEVVGTAALTSPSPRPRAPAAGREPDVRHVSVEPIASPAASSVSSIGPLSTNPIPTATPDSTSSAPPPATDAPTAAVEPPSTSVPSTGVVVRSGRQLLLNGAPYRFTGFNIGPEVCGGNSTMETTLDAIGPGQEAFRHWFFQSYATVNGQRDWSKLDRVMAVAQARGQRVIATLANQWTDCEGSYGFTKSENWYGSGYRTGPYTPDVPSSYREWVAEVVGRYQTGPILMWQMMNEAQADTGGVCSTTAGATLRAWANDVAALIKSIDTAHLVNVGTIGQGNCGTGNEDYLLLHSSANIDILEVHSYHPAAFPGDQWNGLLARMGQASQLNKPIFNGELGIAVPADVATVELRAQAIEAKAAAHFDAGFVGEVIWNWNNGRGVIDQYDVQVGEPSILILSRY